MRFRPTRRLSARQSAARIAAVLADRLGELVHLRWLRPRTALSMAQFRRGVRFLKVEAGNDLSDAGFAFVVTYSGLYGLTPDVDHVEASESERLNDANSRLVGLHRYLEQLARNTGDRATRRSIRAAARAVNAARDFVGAVSED